MLGKAITLFEIFGFKVKVDMSWAFLAILIAWSLSQGYFPELYGGLPTATYWWMGLAGMAGLFLSIVLHELAHSVVARAFGMEIKGITLWLLGGVAEMADEPPTPLAEFVMAIAGPIMSLVLAGICYYLSLVLTSPSLEPAVAVLQYLTLLNVVVTIFNLIPAFPMDGGRVLRAILWAIRGNINWATRMAAGAGSMFGLLLIVVGALNVIISSDLRGMWWIILGMFIRFAADASSARIGEKEALENLKVADIMNNQPVSVPADVTVQQFVDDWLFRYYHDVFPVLQDDRLKGSVSSTTIKKLPRERWPNVMVSEIMDSLSDATSVESDAAVATALDKMRSGAVTRLVVTKAGRLAGMLALKDVLKLIALKTDLSTAS